MQSQQFATATAVTKVFFFDQRFFFMEQRFFDFFCIATGKHTFRSMQSQQFATATAVTKNFVLTKFFYLVQKVIFFVLLFFGCIRKESLNISSDMAATNFFFWPFFS